MMTRVRRLSGQDASVRAQIAVIIVNVFREALSAQARLAREERPAALVYDTQQRVMVVRKGDGTLLVPTLYVN